MRQLATKASLCFACM